jgi:selenide,water dikinase
MDIKLTQFSHGGGCGCKIAPAVLSELLANSPVRNLPKALLVGTESSDDAAVYQLNDEQAIIATTDFFTPIVDNPFDFGRIAATNAISDIYAMGGQPIMALALVGMPLDKLPLEVIRDILAGGESVCADAGIPIAGGHSIDVLEPIYGLVALGIVHPQKVKRNNQAKAGDKIILGKPLGVGILSAALKKGILSPEGYAQMLRYTTQLNQVGVKLSNVSGVHALTDVTGFGLAGHLLEICRGSNVSAEVDFSSVPMINEALPHVQAGIFTGASTRNWADYGKDVHLTGDVLPEKSWQQQMMTDPQTSGGLLVACSPETEQEVLGLFHNSGFEDAKTIGELVPVTNTPCIKVTI